MKNLNDTVSVLEVSTSKDSNHTHNVITPASTTEETISEPSEYEVMRTNAIAEKNRAIQNKLEKVLNYTKQTMVAYMSEEDLNCLCAYVSTQFRAYLFERVLFSALNRVLLIN